MRTIDTRDAKPLTEIIEEVRQEARAAERAAVLSELRAKGVGPCIFSGCVSTDRHWHGGFPGGFTNPADPEGAPIEFTTEPAPGVRDYNGALLDAASEGQRPQGDVDVFEEVRRTAFKSVPCANCGRKVRRQRTFWQTINPWNLNGNGEPATRLDIQEKLRIEAEAWQAEPESHARCVR